LEIAVQEGFTRLVEKLIRAGARVRSAWERNRAVMDAVQLEEPDILRMLLEEGLSGMKTKVTAESFVTAAQTGRDEAVRLLLKHGAKIDARINTSFDSRQQAEGVTALMGAARYGHESTVRLLLEAGANPMLEDAIGWTAFDWAQEGKHKSVQARICRLLEATLANRRSPRRRS
jgi:ankyrin repeat protein